MKTSKNIGIFMDHMTANLIELTVNPMETKTIESGFTHDEKELTLEKSEKGMHNKEQHLQNAYYKQLKNVIKNYADVLLFGPTRAKVELFNLIKEDPLFNKTVIEVMQTDHLTENQQHAFVQGYFSGR